MGASAVVTRDLPAEVIAVRSPARVLRCAPVSLVGALRWAAVTPAAAPATDPPVAVVGAAGKTGRAVVAALTARGVPVRALVHHPGTWPDERVVELADLDGLTVALRDVRAVYHLAPNLHPDEEGIGARIIEAATRAGAVRLVYHSVLHPQLPAMPHHAAKLAVETRVIESGLVWTILGPAAYLQNLLPAGEEIAVPYRLDAPFSLVDLDDVAEAAARVLVEPGHEHAIYELAGPAVTTVAQVAAIAGVPARQVDRATWLAEQRGQLGEYAISALAAMFAHYDRHGLVGNPRILAGLLGRCPTTVEQAWASGRWTLTPDRRDGP